MDGDTPHDRLQLFESVCEDWHALMCFPVVRVLIMYSPTFCQHTCVHNTILTRTIVITQIIWKKCYAASSRDHGTLGHFCSLLGRLPKVKKPKENMNACVDILFTVLKGHFIASACKKKTGDYQMY